ncbi:MAG: nucleotidyltransferase domain-containing protein [Myxococcota bacterium]|nr:nucleotidyltransferase domain-containing protein [Myxococcota bacterium]
MRQVDRERLRRALEARPEVVFALLFGSAGRGPLPRADSDIDVAVLLDRPLTYELWDALVDSVVRACGIEPVDLVDLARARPLLAFEALGGDLLFVRDRERWAAFFSTTCREYEDEMFRIRRAIQPGSGGGRNDGQGPRGR